MKKILLTVSLFLIFGIYVLLSRSSPANQQVAATTPESSATAPLSRKKNPASSATAPTPAQSPMPTSQMHMGMGTYKDGTYTGSVANAFFGNVQVQATISGGKITDVQFLQYPSDRSYSQYVNSQAMPYLTQEAIQAQSSNVNIVSGATQTSQAFQQSLASALSQAM
ncbi:FMN-binding protein [Patescibacteria group bacterium]|nr:FMN-binding protein [Patescibacteria group bacterium]MCL5114808.1 FMN-binding protein [Patescibacteria group bacterium]